MRTIRRLLTALVAAAILIGPTVASAPDAHAATIPTWVTVKTTRLDFEKHRTDTYSIKTKAHQRSGKGIVGRAVLYINDRQQRWHRLRHGNSLFRITRADLREGKSKISVAIYPHNPKQRARMVTRYVVDKPQDGLEVLRAARTQLGDRYRLGATGPSAWDCSSFTRYAYKKGTGKNLPRTSSAQAKAGPRTSNPRPGDLVYTPGHISIYVSPGRVIEASSSRGVREGAMWQRNVKYIRINH